MANMSTKRTCDICGKEIGRRWFELKQIYKEMDYGMHMDEGKYDICSKVCMIKLLDGKQELDNKKSWCD
jgi:hypothetical protein